MKKLVFFILTLPFAAFSQPTETLTIEEIMQKTMPKVLKTYSGNHPFLVVSNYRNGKRWKYFEGDIIRFKSKENAFFEEEIAYIEDSTFTIFSYNDQINRLEKLTFKIDDIKSVYKHKRVKIWKTGLYSIAPMLPYAALDWGLFHIPPHQNKDLLILTPIIGVGNLLISGHKNLFNRQRLKGNRDLRIVIPVNEYPKEVPVSRVFD